jgi:hypothetical protein
VPEALKRACAGQGGTCPNLSDKGLCVTCRQAREGRRGSAAARGYDSYWSKVFRPRFVLLLIAAGVTPACGAALPGGPMMAASTCKAKGLLTTDHLHLHHDPPLRDDERRHRHLVCDPLRVGFLCATDHSRETQADQRAGVL